MIRLHLIRHGETDWNVLRRVQGHSESQLTPTGIDQARQLHKYLSAFPIEQVYCSSSQRTRDTARLLFPEAKFTIKYMDELREIFLGPWEGQLYSDLEQTHGEQFTNFWQYPHMFSVSGAESFAELQRRSVAAIEKILHDKPAQEFAIVSHGAFLKALLCHYEKRPLAALWQPPQMHNCAHSLLEIQPDQQTRILRYAGIEWPPVSETSA